MHIHPCVLDATHRKFVQVRYYTILLVMYDVIQIHTFQIPGVTSDTVSVGTTCSSLKRLDADFLAVDV